MGAGAGIEGAHHVLGIEVHGQHDAAHLGAVRRCDAARQLNAVAAAQRDVQHRDLRLLNPLCRQRLPGGLAVGADPGVEIGLEQGANAVVMDAQLDNVAQPRQLQLDPGGYPRALSRVRNCGRRDPSLCPARLRPGHATADDAQAWNPWAHGLSHHRRRSSHEGLGRAPAPSSNALSDLRIAATWTIQRTS